MSPLIEYPVAGSSPVLVATSRSELSDQGVFRGGGSREVVTRSAETMQAAIARLKPAAHAVVETFADLPRRPDALSITFGVELTAEAGAIIASTAATAHFSVTISWNAAESAQPEA